MCILSIYIYMCVRARAGVCVCVSVCVCVCVCVCLFVSGFRGIQAFQTLYHIIVQDFCTERCQSFLLQDILEFLGRTRLDFKLV